MSLEVASYNKTRTRTPEKAFEKMFAASCEHLGIWSRHMSDAFPGIPDRYLAGGRWVELKSVICPSRELPTGYGLSPEQRVIMEGLRRAGDSVWYLALVMAPSGKKVLSLQTAAEALGNLFYPIYNVERFPPYTSESLDAMVMRIANGNK